MMLSLPAINMLLVSVIAFSYADLSNMITFTPGIVNNCTNDFRLNLASAVTVYTRNAPVNKNDPYFAGTSGTN